jgi:two-component system, OmpR family, sensor histidine kinase KdpD
MSTTDSYSLQLLQTFKIQDEPGVGILVLDKQMRVAWASDSLADILSVNRDEILGNEFCRVLEKHVSPLVRERSAADGLLSSVLEKTEVESLDLPLSDPGGADRLLVYQSQRIREDPFAGMWILRVRDVTGEAERRMSDRGEAICTLQEIARLVDAEGASLDDVLSRAALLIPSGLCSPESVGVRITYGGAVYTHRYTDTPHRITAGIGAGGSVEVARAGDPADTPGSLFSQEEEQFVRLAASMLANAARMHRAEEALREGEERHKTSLKKVRGIEFMGGPDFEPVILCGAVEEITGYTEEEFLAGLVSWSDLVHPEDRPGFQASIEATAEREYRIVRKDGGICWVRDLIRTIRGADGEPVSLQGTLQDITDRKVANEGLLSFNRHLSVLNQIAGVSASSLSLDELLGASLSRTLDLTGFEVGLTYMLNPERTRALLRYHRAVPKPFLSKNSTVKVHHWPWNFVFVAGQPRYLEQGDDLGSLEATVLESLGITALACIPLLAESVVVGAVFVGSRGSGAFKDDERRLLEAIGKEIGAGILRSMLHKRLEAAHREANLYLDIMTHDIKNAENVSSLYCDLLIEMLAGEAGQYAKRLQRSVRKSSEIIQNVSTIRRIHQEPANLAPVHLGCVIKAELAYLPEASVRYEDVPVEVWADDLLPEIFSNLVGNAVKFGGPDVEVGILVEESPDEDGMVLVTVEDTGPGIPDAVKESAFFRFEQGKDRGQGEGLGLAIVGMLVERYGGRIWVEDRVEGHPEQGASFRFTLREVVHPGIEEDEDEYDEDNEYED